MLRLDKSRIYPIVLLILMFVVYKYREHQNNQLQFIEGNTMGTTYHIKYLSKYNLKKEVDSILVDFNNSVSTYIPSSEISAFNKIAKLNYSSPYFYPIWMKSVDIYEKSNGAFNPLVMPLVNAWGFGFKNKERIDSSLIDSLVQLTDMSQMRYDDQQIKSLRKRTMIDFSALAKGYGVDVIADFLRSKKIYHFMVEIGGEVVCSGQNQDEKNWTIGINNPKYEEEGGEQLSQVIELNNMALATSGNYRNFYIDSNGVKRAHTINPKTGYPVNHSLLSASVKAKNCMTADGYATALMVLGFEEGKKVVEKVNEIEAFLIYDNNGKLETWSSNNFFKNEN